MGTRSSAIAILALCGSAACKKAAPVAPASAFTAADVGAGSCTGINASGQVVGTDESGQAFIIAAGGARTALPALADGSMAVALSINDSGQVVGYSQSATSRQAMVYAHGAWQPIPQLAGGSWSIATAVNAAGSVVGAGTVGQVDGGTLPPQHAFRYQSGAPVDLGTLGGANSSANALSDDGAKIAGRLESADGNTHAFLWSAGRFIDLGTLGGANSAAFGVNKSGDVVGVAETPAGNGQAFFQSQGLMSALP